MKISEFITLHYSSGELYMEYIKCIENKCSFCIGCPWRSPTLKGVPRPMPDVSKLPFYHYLDVFITPLVDYNKLWPPDDFIPRAVVKKLFKEGELQNMEDIKTFANQYVVMAEMVNDYIKHLKNMANWGWIHEAIASYSYKEWSKYKENQEIWGLQLVSDGKGWFNWPSLNWINFCKQINYLSKATRQIKLKL